MVTLVVGGILLMQAIGLALVFATPAPQLPRSSAAELAAVLRGGPVPANLVRTDRSLPPAGLRAFFVEAAIARLLGLPEDKVRAVWSGRADTSVDSAVQARAVVISRDGRVVTMLMPPGARPPALHLSKPMIAAVGGMPIAAVAVAVLQPDGRWTVVEPRAPFWSGWRLRIAVPLALSALMLVPIAWFMARRVTRPLRRLAAHADRPDLAADSAPFDEGPREIRVAAAAIDAMRVRLAANEATRIRMVAAMAHDLRTPLTGLRLRVESVAEPLRERMCHDIARMEGMIVEVLAFAQSARRDGTLAPVDLVEVAQAIVADAALRGERVALAVDGDIPAVPGNRADLVRATTNLVDNALSYAGDATIRLLRRGNEVHVRIEDRGSGIPPDERARLLEPFERGDASRNRATGGVGLGLSIARDIVQAHGGSLTFEDDAEAGFAVFLRFGLIRETCVKAEQRC